MGMQVDIAALKTLALLHDPPFKPLLFAAHSGRDAAELVRYVIGLREEQYREEKVEEYHERLARYIIDKIARRLAEGGKDDLAAKIKSMQEECRPLIERCDYASSSIDRSIAYLFFDRGKMRGKFVNRVIFKHPLDLSEHDFTNDLRRLLYDEDGNLRVDQFATAVNEFIDSICRAMVGAEPGYEYHALWRTLPASYVYSLEKAFNNRFPEASLLPADTRSPTSTIIDHLYATSCLATAATDSEIGLIYWEVENKQEFISTARLPRDLWSGSYLISLTTFYALMNIADELGPDCIIRPLLHNAPLYDAYLSTKSIPIDLSAITGEDGKKEDDLGFPMIGLPIIPGAVLAIVPGREVEDYASKILQWYIDAWNKISEVFLEKIGSLRQEVKKYYGLVEVVGDEDEWRRMAQEPPFNVNIAYLRVPWQRDERDKLIRELSSKSLIDPRELEYIKSIRKIEEKASRGGAALGESFYEWSLLIRALTRLHFSLSQTKTITSFEEVNVTERTRLCTVCWRRKAILHLAKIEEAGVDAERFGGLMGELHGRGIWIKDGERLCFHCIVRRGLYSALYEVLEKIIQMKLVKKGGRMNGHYPSTEEIAGLAFASTLAAFASSDIDRKTYNKLAESISNIIEKYNRIFREDIQAIPKDDGEFTKLLTIFRKALPPLYEEHYLRVGSIQQFSKDSEEALHSLRELRKSFLELVNSWRDDLKAWNPSSLIKLLSNMKAGSTPAIVRWPSDYLALVKGDGDFISDMLSGRGYYEKKAIEMIPSMLMDYVSGLGGGDAEKINADEVNKLVWLPGLSYTYTISRALMVNSINASKTIYCYGGLVIYSGGDDVLAMLPPEVTTTVVGRLRIGYSERFIEVEDNVSLKKEKVVYKIPGLGSRSSQSFGILFFDAFFPLKLVIEEVSALIDEAKEVECLSGVKDSMVISYGVGGLKSYISFKLMEVDKLTRLLTSLAFSASLQSRNRGLMKDGKSYIIVDGFSEKILRFGRIHERETLDVFLAHASRAGVSGELINELRQLFDRNLSTNKGATNLLTELIKASLCQASAMRESYPIALGC
jgi:CRISPR-associated protein Cas10/Cmr2 subtype III-B